MRYDVGETSVFIYIAYKIATPRFGRLYLPWEDELRSINILPLTCIEHHRVPGEWDDKIEHDGFVFQDEQGQRWANQYPRASYGQLDDSQDRMVHRYLNKAEQDSVLNKNGGDGPSRQEIDILMRNYTDATTVLQTLLRGIEYSDLEESQKQSLKDHQEDLIKRIHDTGFRVTRTPWVINFPAGREPEPAPAYLDRYLIEKI